MKNLTKSNISLTFIVTTFIVLDCVLLFYFRKKQRKTYNKIIIKKNLLLEKDKIIHQKEEETKELKLKVNQSFNEVIQLAKENHPEFITRFSEVYPEFYQKLLTIEPKLLKAEIRFCELLYLNFTTKDIADYTFVTVKAVQHRKFRIRKKLNIPSNVDINEWIINLQI